MDVKWLCVYFPLALILCSGTFAKAEEDCQSANAKLYYVDIGKSLTTEHYVAGKHHASGLITINSTKIRALAFDHRRNEVLFVDNENPATIWGVSKMIDVHMVLHEEGAHFDWIVVDPVTNNIYFADNNRGIGVCSGHGSNTSCTLLIPKASGEQFFYKDLILYPRRGVMFWIEFDDILRIYTKINMASMNGHHPRTFKDSILVESIALDTQNDRLYISDGAFLDTVSINNHSRVISHSYKSKSIFVLNCAVHALERKPRLHSICTTGHCFEIEAGDELLLQDINSRAVNPDQKPAENHSILVLDSDLVPKPNPCKSIQCSGICVLTEAFPEPLPDCVCETCNKPKIERIVEEKVVEKVKLQEVRNPLNGVLVATTIILLLALVFILALIFSPKLRILLREQIARIFGKKSTVGFVNQASRGSTVSAMSNDL